MFGLDRICSLKKAAENRVLHPFRFILVSQKRGKAEMQQCREQDGGYGADGDDGGYRHVKKGSRAA